ncbi:DUF2442 domain-containing protein [Paraburkholderia sp. HP33-1]|uniref:DUF2442 domain-containing protein n=1 Tax=Paraburkholderia sp. HP33-1 TaxID=2883243 RepID=UPI001F201E6E|nr:DUF2442 domain-containing protein [Paraburkholderia sp. HP33-1]
MTSPDDPVAVSVTINAGDFTLLLTDERKFRIPWKWFTRLLAATPEQRSSVRVCESGARLHWDQVDLDINVVALIHDAEQLLLDEELSSLVPDDFPNETTPASLSGAQPKLAARRIAGRIVVGLTARERYERWDVCEDLARQLVPKALKDATKFPENSRDVTLRRLRRAIEGKEWTEGLETDWLIERLRALLGW